MGRKGRERDGEKRGRDEEKGGRDGERHKNQPNRAVSRRCRSRNERFSSNKNNRIVGENFTKISTIIFF